MRTLIESPGQARGQIVVLGITLAISFLLITDLSTGISSANYHDMSSETSTDQLTQVEENEAPKIANSDFAETIAAPRSYGQALSTPRDMRRLRRGLHQYRQDLEAESQALGGLGSYPIFVGVDASGGDASVGPVDTSNYVPAVTISASDSPIAEGENVLFVLTRHSDTTAELAVTVSVTENGAMIRGTPPSSVTIPVGQVSGTLTITTENDTAAEDDSVITATLIGHTFTDANLPVPTSTSAEVIVRDDDPVVSFTAPASITEGEPAVFTFSRVGGLSYDLALNLDFFLEGHFLQDYEIGELWFAAGEAVAVLSIPTEDDDMPEPDGIIGVHLQPRYFTPHVQQPYYPEPSVYREVVVRDNDRPAITTATVTSPFD